MYPSDLTDVQWSKLEPLLKEPRGKRHVGHERRAGSSRTSFCFWYTFWGAILWGIGPIIIALLPSSWLGRYATAYLSKVGEWLMWPILYAIGAIMVA
jgi:hypothetical protein